MAQSIHIRTEIRRYLNRDFYDSRQELSRWGWWNRNNKYFGAPSDNPKSLAGKIFTVSVYELHVPKDVNKTARAISLLPDQIITVLWGHYVLEQWFPPHLIKKAQIAYSTYKNELQDEPLSTSIYF